MESRSSLFDNLRAGLIFLVVLGHFLEEATMSTYAPYGTMFIYLFHMPLFVFVSGMFFNINDTEKAHQRAISFFIIYILMKGSEWIVHCVFYHDTAFSLLDTRGIPWFMFALAVWNILTPLTRSVDTRLLLLISVCLSLVVRYDDNINSFLMLSRIIVFWPFFLLGTIVERNTIEKITEKRWCKCAGAIALISICVIIVCLYDEIKVINPLLTGQNPYSNLDELCAYGCLLRLCIYIIECIMSISFMILVPKKKLISTYIGTRTLSVYFFDVILDIIYVNNFTGLHFYAYFLLSVFFTIVFSTKPFYYPIQFIMDRCKK